MDRGKSGLYICLSPVLREKEIAGVLHLALSVMCFGDLPCATPHQKVERMTTAVFDKTI